MKFKFKAEKIMSLQYLKRNKYNNTFAKEESFAVITNLKLNQFNIVEWLFRDDSFQADWKYQL